MSPERSRQRSLGSPRDGVRKALYGAERSNEEGGTGEEVEQSEVSGIDGDARRVSFDDTTEVGGGVAANVVERNAGGEEEILAAEGIDEWTQDGANDPTLQPPIVDFSQAEDVSCTQLEREDLGESPVTRMHAMVRGGVFYHVNPPQKFLNSLLNAIDAVFPTLAGNHVEQGLNWSPGHRLRVQQVDEWLERGATGEMWKDSVFSEEGIRAPLLFMMLHPDAPGYRFSCMDPMNHPVRTLGEPKSKDWPTLAKEGEELSATTVVRETLLLPRLAEWA